MYIPAISAFLGSRGRKIKVQDHPQILAETISWREERGKGGRGGGRERVSENRGREGSGKSRDRRRGR